MITEEGRRVSKEGLIKILWRGNNKRLFESVIVPFYDKNFYTLCLSTQSGCHMGCKICQTSRYNYPGEINLSVEEILEQALLTGEIAKENFAMPLDEISFMGMGEPLDNLVNVCESVESLSDRGYERIAISTVGIIKGLEFLINYSFKKAPRLQLSLHGINNRNTLIPIDKTNSARAVIPLCIEYSESCGSPLTLNWALIEGINDYNNEAVFLGESFDPRKTRINLSSYLGKDYPASSQSTKERFKQLIEITSYKKYGAKTPVNIFQVKGEDIEAGCGQLVGNYIADNL